MPELIIDLDITPGQMTQYYRGLIHVVQARAVNGKTVQFPAWVLQKVVAQDGVHGRYRLLFDDNNKLIGLEPATRVS